MEIGKLAVKSDRPESVMLILMLESSSESKGQGRVRRDQKDAQLLALALTSCVDYRS